VINRSKTKNLGRQNHLKKILLLSAFIYSNCFCQTDELQNILARFDQYNNKSLQEKIFVHTDKSFYTTGEILWFKLYVTNALSNNPIDLSKVAYIEIYNKDLKPVLQGKIALKKGSGNGSFFLPSSISSGKYKFRAYTNWMKNFGPDCFFEKNISIINLLKKPDPLRSDTLIKYDIQFFPEGGILVNSIQSKVAFKVTSSEGKGVDGNGEILDSKNNIVANFKTFKFGMGSFLFTPLSGEKYKAVISVNNKTVNAELPDIYNNGYTLQLEDISASQIKLTVKTNIAQSAQSVYLIAHSKSTIESAQALLLNQGTANAILNKSDLKEGISGFTIFDENKKPLCERLYFKRPEKKLFIDAELQKKEFGNRQKVDITLSTYDETRMATKADMSMSVFLSDSLQPEDENSITSYMLLSSELKGNIESLDYYFKDGSAETNEAIDNLMLTQGWRRFKWNEAISNNSPILEFAPEYEGHIITGRITNKTTKQPAEKIKTFLSVPGYQFQLGSSESNQKGEVRFDLNKFYGSPEIIVEAGDSTDSMYHVDITNPFYEKFSDTRFQDFQISKSLSDQLSYHSTSSQVQSAYLNDSLQKFNPPYDVYDSTAFYGQPDRKYFLDDYTRFSTMEEVLREYVGSISVRKQQGKFHINAMDNSYHYFFDDDPLILLDGLPVSNVDKIISLDPLLIKKIELVNRKYFLGSSIFDGIINFYSYKGDLAGFQLDPNAVILEYEGLQLQREFYSPVYDVPQKIKSRLPDFRNTLYWSPDIVTNPNGKKQISFYTSDLSGNYTILIQGITADGRTGSSNIKFSVGKSRL